MNYSRITKLRGFSLVEILGAVAVLATLATVSVVSIKGTVQAGQKASAQREIQVLNSALQNFKSAGGVIPEDFGVDNAIAMLKDGVDLAGSEYAPLLENEPQREVTIAGETYTLAYDPVDGFSYENAGGAGIGFGGSDLAPASMGLPDPAPLLLGYEAASDKSEFLSTLSPVEQASLFQALGAEEQVTAITALKDAGDSTLKNMLTHLPAGEAGPALNNLESLGFADLSGLDLTGLNLSGRYLDGVNFAGSTITGAQLNEADYLGLTDLSATNLTGLDLTGRDMDSVNFVGSNITAEQLNAADNIQVPTCQVLI